jgi:hypothetical protein
MIYHSFDSTYYHTVFPFKWYGNITKDFHVHGTFKVQLITFSSKLVYIFVLEVSIFAPICHLWLEQHYTNFWKMIIICCHSL